MKNGALMRQEFYLDNKRDGLMTEYRRWKIITKGEFVDDMQEGLWSAETPEYKEIGKICKRDKPG